MELGAQAQLDRVAHFLPCQDYEYIESAYRALTRSILHLYLLQVSILSNLFTEIEFVLGRMSRSYHNLQQAKFEHTCPSGQA